MDDIEDDDRYPSNIYVVSDRHGHGSSNRQKLPVRNVPISRPIGDQYGEDNVDDDDDDDDEEEEGEEDEVEDLGEEEDDPKQNNGVRYVGKGMDDLDDDDDDDDDDLLDDDEDDDNVDLGRHQKKRKLKSLLSSYEFAPRVTTPAVPTPSVLKPSYGGRNSLTGWTEHETFVLLDAWGYRFLQCGRKSLRTEEWQDVAEKVSEISKDERTETQCRNRLDTLKKKYKKEKSMLAETGATTSKWVYFKKIDILMPTPQQGQLSCGFDSGEYVFMNPRVYLNRANGLDEMRDSPANSESANEEEDISDGLPPKKRNSGKKSGEGSSVRVLADSIHKFSDEYEKIENSRKQQMLELETMRMDIHRELEMQKRQIMERARAEIAKMHQGNDDEANDVSADNASR